MYLGHGGIDWFDYVPRFRGNRDLPEGGQLRLQVKRLTGAELLARQESPGDPYGWRNKALAHLLDMDPDTGLPKPEQSTELGTHILEFSVTILSVFQRFVEHTRNFQNFEFDDGCMDDPIQIFLELSSMEQDPETEDGLIGEIMDAINQSGRLRGDELKNFVSGCGGSNSETIPPAKQESPSVNSVPISDSGLSAPLNASTNSAPTALSTSEATGS
jgi:hypothetical protein